MCQMGEFWNKFSCLFIVLKVLSQSLMDELKAFILGGDGWSALVQIWEAYLLF